jgi:hypothetical protein
MSRKVANVLLGVFVSQVFALAGCGGGGDSGGGTSQPTTTITTPAPSSTFVDKGNGTLYNSTKNLSLLKNANCFGALNWKDAYNKTNVLASGICGLTDGSTAGKWRIPTAAELSIIFSEAKSPYGVYYWSSNSCVAFSSGACYMLYNGGSPDFGYEFDNHYVWPIRSGQ